MKLRILQIKEAAGEFANSPDAIAQLMKEEAKADRECFWVLHMNTKLQVIEKELVAMGTLEAAYIHPREVFRKAVINSTARIITVHNHPSGFTEPSPEDEKTWKKLVSAGEILGIDIADNIVIGSDSKVYSQKLAGKL